MDSKKIILNYGLALGGASISVALVKHFLGANYTKEFYSIIASSFAFIGLIVFGIKTFKLKNKNFLSWGEGVKIGVGIAIISAVLVGFYQYIFNTYIEPDYMKTMMEIQAQNYLESGMDEESVEAAIAMSEKFTSPIITTAMGIIGSAIGGFIVAAIASASMKNEKQEM